MPLQTTVFVHLGQVLSCWGRPTLDDAAPTRVRDCEALLYELHKSTRVRTSDVCAPSSIVLTAYWLVSMVVSTKSWPSGHFLSTQPYE